MMVIFWALTPLINAVFQIAHENSSAANIAAAVVPAGQWFCTLTSGFLMTAYGILWLDQDLLRFTINDSALLPFASASTDAVPISNGTWTSRTTMYSTTLACKPTMLVHMTEGSSYSDGNRQVVLAVSVRHRTSPPITSASRRTKSRTFRSLIWVARQRASRTLFLHGGVRLSMIG